MDQRRRNMPSPKARNARKPKQQKPDHAAMRAVFEGSLTLAQAGDVSASELNAIAAHAESQRRQGNLSGALELYQTLALADPYEPRWWTFVAGLHQRLGDFAPALAGYEMVDVLGGANAETASRHRHCEQQLDAQLVAGA